RPCQNNFFNPDGSQWSPKVSEMLTPEPLGYTYAVPSVAALAAAPAAALAPAALAQSQTFKALYAVPNLAAAKPPGISAYVTTNSQAATPAKYLEVPVQVDANVQV